MGSGLVKGVGLNSDGNRGTRRRFRGIAATALAVAIAQICAAQNPTLKTRTNDQRQREFLASHRVTMNVQVNDAAGKSVPDLSMKDFVLIDDHQPRKIAALREIDGTIMNDATEIVIVLDAVNSTTQELEAEKNGIFKYLAQSHGPLPYPTSFALWSNGHLKATAGITDRNELGRAFVRLTKGLHSNGCSPVDGSVERAAEGGGAGALGTSGIGQRAVSVATCEEVHFRDSIAALDGIAQQQKNLGGRTLLIWVGPGWPLLSDVKFQRSTPKARQALFEEIVAVLGDLRAAQVTLDEVAPRDLTRETEMAALNLPTGKAGAASSQDSDPSSLALQILVRQSGGRLMATSTDVTADLAQCIRDADGYYSLSFEMMPTSAAHELHRVEVKVNRPGLEVRTMAVYYAEP